MAYQRQLAFYLRGHGYAENEIAEILRELREHGSSDAELTQEFGAPSQYAAQFDKKKRVRTLGGRIATAGTLLGLAWIVFILVTLFVFHFDVRELVGPVALWPALAIVIGGVLVGFLSDYLRPTPSSEPAAGAAPGRTDAGR
ncbi:hypothetical protein [Luethyella okanaganae]|uniref:DUF1707 domain-containing protein n=1 Tax=Luethyella okanaganae TaxID=69372 RepID=A0ABW1VIS0_9MICO